MQIKLNGATFDVDAVGMLDVFDTVWHTKSLREVEHQQVYVWTCKPPGKGQFRPPAAANGKVPLRNLALFAEPNPNAKFKSELGPAETRVMQRRYLAKTSATSMNDLRRAVDRLFRTPVVDVPIASFAWMNPMATYVIDMRIDYALFRCENTPLALRFYILVPHRARFTAEVLDYCLPSAFAELEAGGKDPDAEQVLLHRGANARNHEWRRAALRQRIMQLEDPFWSGGPSEADKERIEELRRELAGLAE